NEATATVTRPSFIMPSMVVLADTDRPPGKIEISNSLADFHEFFRTANSCRGHCIGSELHIAMRHDHPVLPGGERNDQSVLHGNQTENGRTTDRQEFNQRGSACQRDRHHAAKPVAMA